MKKIIILIALSFLLLLFYGWLIEPQTVVVKRVQIKDNSLFRQWGQLRIVHISDIHLTHFGRREIRIIETINRLDPHIVCVTGDLGQWGATNTDVIGFLRSIRSRYGVFVVLGDSDMSSGRQRCFYCHWSNDIHRLRQRPRFLNDRCVDVALGPRHTLRLCGVSPETGNDQDKIAKFVEKNLIPESKDGRPVLVLSHFSRYWSKLPPNLELLWLSGNTHGGQIWTPGFLRPYLFRDKDFRHLEGLFHSGKGEWLYVNPGLGTTEGVPIRIGVPPEITVIDIASDRQ